MPSSRHGRVLAVVYLLAVAGSVTTWMVQGAYSTALIITLLLTLPWSLAAYSLLMVAALAVLAGPGADSGPGQVALTMLAVLLFLSAAAANVLMTGPLLLRWRKGRPDATS
ncbi:hypothetical protein [Blastococcus haudaquaticus]|uniref:Uncharacterized protein n=1 Tax=Blastococcus haudaquaticus TaxID=1938745 RepID=A0A286GU16_9ACTN|nr:hypothetical protein [Blastococcus haudaquaticus]SOD99047.1 hypothetical protein SAMN06272739_2149 [Blastococcus haudaquaticus]